MTVSSFEAPQAKLWVKRQIAKSRPRIGSDATFFWDSLSNLDIDDNFRISHNLGLGLAANISTALVYGAAVHFFLADGDLQQREWIFCSSVISQKV